MNVLIIYHSMSILSFSERFGLYQVDFNSLTKNRTARLSALVYKNIIKTKEVDFEWMPQSLQIEIDQPNKVKVEL